MAGKVSVFLTLLPLIFALASPLHAQKMGEYSFEPSSEGTPIFTQVLRWAEDPNVLYYEFTLQNAAGETLSVSKLEEPVVELNLGPGEYRYKLALYNLLGKLDLELPWRNFTVLKAELPRVTEVIPNAWFSEDRVSEITLTGENISPGATIELRRSTASEEPITAQEVAREGETVRVTFPASVLTAGTYSVVVVNPGGLSSTLPNAITIRRERAVEVFLSVGYAPWISLYDSWYKEAWPGTFFPKGFIARLSAYFIKRPYGNFGAELSFAGQSMEGGSEGAVVESLIGMTGLNGVFRHPFSREIAVALRTGGGVVMSRNSFDYEGTSGSELYSLDPYVSLGFSFQYFPVKRVFLEAGTDWVHVFTSGFMQGGLQPTISAGVKF